MEIKITWTKKIKEIIKPDKLTQRERAIACIEGLNFQSTWNRMTWLCRTKFRLANLIQFVAGVELKVKFFGNTLQKLLVQRTYRDRFNLDVKTYPLVNKTFYPGKVTVGHHLHNGFIAQINKRRLIGRK